MAATDLSRLELGNISMAAAHQAGDGDGFDPVATAQPSCASRRAPRLAPKLLALTALSCALAVAGCAPATQRLSGTSRFHAAAPARIHIAAPVQRRAAPRARPIDQSLLTAQPAPDCDYKEPEAATADPNVWARLKLDYERQCYRKAETSVRERLELVQTSLRKCGVEPVRPASRARRKAARPIAGWITVRRRPAREARLPAADDRNLPID
jgi:hypothetical protein